MKYKRPTLFNGHWIDEDGARHKIRRAELREANRLWWKHKDIRLGKVKA